MTEEIKTITISLSEYESLKEDSKWLRALEDAGLDNWEGVSFAHELLKGYEDEDT